MVLLMVPMVPLERWGGAFWQTNSRKQGILTGSCKALMPGPKCKRFLSPHGGGGVLAPNVKSPRSSLWLGCAKGLWELELDVPRGMWWQGCSGELQRERE